LSVPIEETARTHWLVGCQAGRAGFETVAGGRRLPTDLVPSSDGGPGQLLFVRGGTLLAQPFDASRLILTDEPVTVAERLGTASLSPLSFGYFSVSANGTLVYGTGGGTSGVLQLTWFDRQGRILGTLGERGVYSYPALSPDGKRAVVGRLDPQNGKQALWLVDFSRGTTRFTFGSSNSAYPIWSPDGNRIVFASDREGPYDLYQKLASGASDEEPLRNSSKGMAATSFSHDRRFLRAALERRRETRLAQLSGPICPPLRGNQ
jgi:WD40-like Beta Propeller Repeat